MACEMRTSCVGVSSASESVQSLGGSSWVLLAILKAWIEPLDITVTQPRLLGMCKPGDTSFVSLSHKHLALPALSRQQKPKAFLVTNSRPLHRVDVAKHILLRSLSWITVCFVQKKLPFPFVFFYKLYEGTTS